MAEIIDDNALLGIDDDELDYDLEKDEEDALLADPDNENFDEHYDENQLLDEHHYDDNEEVQEEDVLDIDSNVRLDEVEDDLGDQALQDNKIAESRPLIQEEEEDEFEEQKERNRFNSERNQNQIIHRLTSNEIPDSLEKITVQPFNKPVQNNYQRNNNNNGRFYRGRGRGRGGRSYYNNNNNNAHGGRTSVFGRVGHNPVQSENKTVLINPHFRGNVQANENARLVWDPNSSAINPAHPRFTNNPVMPVAPFHTHPSPWVVPPYSEPNTGFNQAPMQQHGYQDQSHMSYGQPPPQDMSLRPLLQVNNQFLPQNGGHQPMTNWGEEPTYNSESIYPNQGNFRGREVRFNQPNNPQVLMNNQSNFNQPNQRNFNQIHQQHRQPLLSHQPNIPPLLPHPPQISNQNFDQQPHPSTNQFMNPQQQQFPPQNQFQQYPQQNFNQNNQQNPPAVFDSYNNQYEGNYNYNYPVTQGPEVPKGPQTAQHNSYDPNFNQQNNFQLPPNNQAQFQQQQQQNQYDNREFNRVNQPRGNNNRNFNQVNNRTPPKRRSFELKNNQNSGERDLSKKKRRSLELSNLHEVPTVDMPDTTTEDKGEEEDEETKAYRKKIEEQKLLREKLVREKEERRKIAAAGQSEQANSNPQIIIEPNKNLIKTSSNLTVVKATVGSAVNRNVINQQEQATRVKKTSVVLQSQQGNIMIQRRVNSNQQLQQDQLQQQQQQQQQQQKEPTNIVITQKVPKNQSQRIVMMKQETQQQQLNIQKTNMAPPGTIQNRRVVLKGINNKDIITTTTTSDVEYESESSITSFLTNRKVISNSSGISANNKSVNLNEGLIQTPIVVVSNLAASTTDVKLRNMCQGLGPIQKIEMIPNSRQATITFKNVISAHKFFKKYQRKIIDLSMIQVTLEALT